MKKIFWSKGYTLMEIMIVIILIGIIAAFGLPNYQKSLDKAHERDALVQLTTIQAANRIYLAQTGDYLGDNPGGMTDLEHINSGLGINILANELTYTYDYDPGGVGGFIATASWTGGGGTTYTLSVDEDPIETGNPCCTSTSCISVTSACN